MSNKTVKDIDLKGKKVLVRCDFNVPYDENRVITDNRRIVAALPTIKYLIENNCKVILCSHLGRPKGEVKPEFSLKPVAKELSKLLGQEVIMAEDVIGEDAKNKAENQNKDYSNSNQTQQTVKKNQFNTFQQRNASNSEVDALEKKLLSNSCDEN